MLNLSCEAEAIDALSAADGILVNLFPMTAGVIDALDRCRVISRYGVGCDNVDIDAATRKGIWVATVPDYSIEDAWIQEVSATSWSGNERAEILYAPIPTKERLHT